MKRQESAKGDSAGQSEVVALPASTLPKRKFSRLASPRQGSRDSTNDVVASPSTPVRTKRPKTTGSLVLDSDKPQDLVGVDSVDDSEAEFNRLIGVLLSFTSSPQDLVGVASDLGLDDVEVMIMEGMPVDDEDVWDAEAVGDDDVSMEEGER